MTGPGKIPDEPPDTGTVAAGRARFKARRAAPNQRPLGTSAVDRGRALYLASRGDVIPLRDLDARLAAAAPDPDEAA